MTTPKADPSHARVMSKARRVLVGLALTLCLGIVGLVCGGLLVPVFVTAPGFDGLADALGLIFGGAIAGIIVGVVFAIVLSPKKLIQTLEIGLVAAGLSIGLVVYRHLDGQNAPADDAMEVSPPTKPNAPGITPPPDPSE